MKPIKRKAGRQPLTPGEIRQRSDFALNTRLRGEDKDFFAQLLEERQAEFNATPADVLTILLRRERERRQTDTA